MALKVVSRPMQKPEDFEGAIKERLSVLYRRMEKTDLDLTKFMSEQITKKRSS